MKICLQCNHEWSDKRDVCPSDGSVLIRKDHDPLIGEVIGGKYKIDQLIGKGSMGAVYRATRQPEGPEVAIKVLQNFLSENSEALIRFKREAKATSRLCHQHIVAGYDFGVMSNGQPFIVMDFIKGISLETLLTQQEYLSLTRSLPIIEQVCQALEYAHLNGIIHRDIKPDNIVLEEKDGKIDFVKVVDFGIAKLVNPTDDGAYVKLTRTGVICGSPAYISPEQIQGQTVDSRSDIYSLAIVIFEMLTGSLPFQANDLVKLLFMHATEKPPTLAQCQSHVSFSPKMEAVIAKALSKMPDSRQQSMRQLYEELKAAARAPTSTYGIVTQQSTSQSSLKDKKEDTLNLSASQGEARVPNFNDSLPLNSQQNIVNEASSNQSSLSVAFRANSRLKQNSSQPLTIWIIALACFALFTLFITAFSWLSQTGDVGKLLNQGRAEEALLVLKQRKRQGKLSASDVSMLNRAYLAMAKKYAQRNQYRSALEMLEQISPKSSYAWEARVLRRRYRNLLSR